MITLRPFLGGIKLKITGFEVSHFKGIRHASIKFAEHDTARVHTLVGLNESGKTTLLEAIHAFSPDAETELVVKNVLTPEQQREQWVPRDRISDFTGDVETKAYVEATPEDWQEYARLAKSRHDITLDPSALPASFWFKRYDRYERGDYKGSFIDDSVGRLNVKLKGSRSFKPVTGEPFVLLARLLRSMLPTIAYYPTFVFSFPDRIYLTDRENTPINRFYRQLFQDILDYDGSGYTIQRDIIDRVRKTDLQGPWEKWFTSFVGTGEEEKVKQVVARAEKAVTELVFSKWNEVFGESVGNKQIQIQLQYDRGKGIKDPSGLEKAAIAHDVYISFWIKDGTNRYKVEDRSLGFRWFFAFLLFTQFRIRRANSKPTVFLFDEPASNLHAAAQKKLLESFPAIASSPHRLIYSTHSHYMIEPQWLEQAAIVFNNAASHVNSIIQESTTKDSDVDVRVVPYREFVQTHPNNTSYFQPILDTLDVVPSHLDLNRGGLIVEGKGDFFFIGLACRIMKTERASVFPARGAGTMGALVALQRGWGLPLRVLFDSDQGGRDGRKKLSNEFALFPDEVFSLQDISPSLKQIEDLISDADKVRLLVDGNPADKKLLLRRVQEMLAAHEPFKFDVETKRRAKALVEGLKQRCPAAFARAPK